MSAWYVCWIAFVKKARLADITPHTLRHTFASLAGDLGFSELTIAALLGHSARGVTQRYIHIDEAGAFTRPPLSRGRRDGGHP